VFKVYIPARFGSTRLPGKPLLSIAGKPMIRRVYERAMESGAAEVVIATDDARIRDCAIDFGASVCMTSTQHPSGTDRIAEAVDLRGEDEDTLIVNLQGDEPGMPGALPKQVAELLEDSPGFEMATLCEPIDLPSDLFDANVVKVVFDETGGVLYFSRAPIPWNRDGFDGLKLKAGEDKGMPRDVYYRHIGLYAYRAGFLREFVRLPVTPLEQIERLEQLRALHSGRSIRIAVANAPAGIGVDTPADVARLLDSSRTVFET
jgi:3-deoxy-manno-octulosonate cytidylyltransferase (CMP-KDO synthetase)